ncbi:MAG: hypothetical protein BWY59_00138 [Verrucomicrobia bacterium ADurb.Bin345]|nr:MAG: hypothetical protein BWY59_00138 [Verrucomicrobia bacterium ADurb.Bin345]
MMFQLRVCDGSQFDTSVLSTYTVTVALIVGAAPLFWMKSRSAVLLLSPSCTRNADPLFIVSPLTANRPIPTVFVPGATVPVTVSAPTEPTPISVVPLATETAVLVFVPLWIRVPKLSVVAPLYVFVPFNTSVPLSIFVTVPAPVPMQLFTTIVPPPWNWIL